MGDAGWVEAAVSRLGPLRVATEGSSHAAASRPEEPRPTWPICVSPAAYLGRRLGGEEGVTGHLVPGDGVESKGWCCSPKRTVTAASRGGTAGLWSS